VSDSWRCANAHANGWWARIGAAAFSTVPALAMSAALTSSVPAPAPVGTMIRWTASVTDTQAQNLWYRFRVRPLNTPFKVIRDFGPDSTLDWTAADHEGFYEIEVTARALDSGETAEASAVFQWLSRVCGESPVISPTSNSLVFLYSAPPCRNGQRMRVRFRGPDGAVQSTPFAACEHGLSMNFYLAGLRPGTEYTAWHTIDTGFRVIAGPAISFTTGEAPPNLFSETVLTAPQQPVSNPLLLGSSFDGVTEAHALDGTLVWYCPNDAYLTRPEPGGTFWGIQEGGADPSGQLIRKFDLMGMTLLETNAARVNEQLKALGARPITAFHHEARTLPGGRILALAAVEQVLTDVQGQGPVDVIGDMIIVFDRDLNVVWTWDAFDHLDTARTAVLGETCAGAGACPPHYLASDANDWTHGNSVQQTADGNLLYSSRHQDWLIKINYNFGEGDGAVIWRLGKDGDFAFQSDDPYPWFSHQHDANFEAPDPTSLMVFDDGNTRVQTAGSGNSRGQVIKLDEQNRTATLVLNADLGVYSLAVGSAEKLRDGDYHFDAGYVPEGNGTNSYSIEVSPAGQVVYEAKANTILYRSFRVANLYTGK
jgi:arylsulfate sulfotransferase